MVFWGKLKGLYESAKSAAVTAVGGAVNYVTGREAPAEKTESYSRVAAPVYSHVSVNEHSIPLYNPCRNPNGNRLERKARYGDDFAYGLAKQVLGKFGTNGDSMEQFETLVDNVALYARDERLDSDYSLKTISRALDIRAKQISEYLQKLDNYEGSVKPSAGRWTRLNKKIITLSSMLQARKRQIEGGWTDMTLDDYLSWEIREKSNAFASGGTANSHDRVTGRKYDNFIDATRFNQKEDGRVIKFKERVYNPEDVTYVTKFGMVYESSLAALRSGSLHALQAEIQRSEEFARRKNIESIVLEPVKLGRTA